MLTTDPSSAPHVRRGPRWAGAVEAVLFVVGLAAQFFLWRYVEALEGRVALMVAMVMHFGIAAVRSRTLAQATSAASASPAAPPDNGEGDADAAPAPPADDRLAFPSTLARQAHALQWADIEAIPGLQANAALRQHHGDKRVYLQSLRRFAQLYKGGVNHWAGWLDCGRWDDLERAVKTLHAQAGSVGALRVQASAGRLAMQCDSEDQFGGQAGLPALQEDLLQVLQPLLDAGWGENVQATLTARTLVTSLD